jgi:hypothetical protein
MYIFCQKYEKYSYRGENCELVKILLYEKMSVITSIRHKDINLQLLAALFTFQIFIGILSPPHTPFGCTGV